MTITRFISAGASLACGAALLLAATAPALAATDPMPPRNDASQQQQYRVKHDAKGNTFYCTTFPAVTGSRISQNVCKTAKDWKAEGIDLNIQ